MEVFIKKNKRHRVTKKPVNYRGIKILFTLCVFIIVTLLIVILLPKVENNDSHRYTTAGICGNIQAPAVYRIPYGSDLGTLILKGGGITFNADIRAIDLNQVIKQDSIYHIPSRKRKNKIPEIIENSDTITFQPAAEEEQYSVLYVGFPALYFIVTYYPSRKRINVIYLPHSTIMLSNEYRLIDVFFTLGINPTIDILEKQLKRRIDSYFIQDRNSFIGMVDELNGLTLPVDSTFARTYNLKTGAQVLDGFLSWEYIRFIDSESYRSKNRDVKRATPEYLELEPNNIQLAYDIRQMRQKKLMSVLYKKFKNLSYVDKSKILTTILKQFSYNSDIPVKQALELLPTLRKDTKLRFGTLPGYYKAEGDYVFYFPYENGVEPKLRNEGLKALDYEKRNAKN